MDRNILQKLFGLIDYKTLYTIYKLGLFGSGLLLASDFSYLTIDLLLLDKALLEFGGRYTRDVQEVKALYQEFLNNYVALSKSFYLSDPIEIWTMFDHMLKNGYLSKDRVFKIGVENIKDMQSILGANIMSGTGVCRHISPMFRDILVNYGYEAYNLVCTLNVKSLWVKATLMNDRTHEEQLRMIDALELDEEVKNNLKNYCYRRWERNQATDVVLEEDKAGLRARLFGDHVIVLVNGEEYKYFLDTLNFYIFESNGKELVSATGNSVRTAKIKLATEWALNELGDLVKLERCLDSNKPIMGLEQAQGMIDSTRKVISNNRDLIEKFYKDNQELYQDIGDKLMRIRK